MGGGIQPHPNRKSLSILVAVFLCGTSYFQRELGLYWIDLAHLEGGDIALEQNRSNPKIIGSGHSFCSVVFRSGPKVVILSLLTLLLYLQKQKERMNMERWSIIDNGSRLKRS